MYQTRVLYIFLRNQTFHSPNRVPFTASKNIPGTLKVSVEVEILSDTTQGGECTVSFILIDTLGETHYVKMFNIYMMHVPLPIISYVKISHTISFRMIGPLCKVGF